MNHFPLFHILGATAALAAFAVPAAAELPSKPNILLVFVDDHRDDTLGCAGHPVVQTPNIDRLAAEGVRFANSFVQSSMCMPSRMTLQTSLSQRTHGGVGPGVLREEDARISYPTLLNQAGYRTAFFGKTHFSSEGGVWEKGLDSFEGIMRPFIRKAPDGTPTHTEDRIHALSLGFLDEQDASRPFCLTVSYNFVHAEDRDKTPGFGHYPWSSLVADDLYEDLDMPLPRLRAPEYFDSLPEFLQTSMNRIRWFWRWDTPEKYQTNMRAYLRMLTCVDRMTGAYMAKLKKKGLDETTVVIYTGDNGYYMGDRGFAGKWSHFEQSLRVPLIVRDPRQPAASRGRVEPAMAVNLDLAPTMLDYAGVPIPDRYQGRSLVPLVRNERPADWRSDIFCEHLLRNEQIPKWEGVRTERYVYANYFEDQYEFLHDLEKDPTQLVNVVSEPEYRTVLEQLRRRTEAYKQLYPERLPAEVKPKRPAAPSGASVVPGN